MEQLLQQLATLTDMSAGQQVVSAKRLQNPLLSLHSAAADMGEGVTTLIEGLLRATTTRSLIASREIDELAAVLHAAVADSAGTAETAGAAAIADATAAGAAGTVGSADADAADTADAAASVATTDTAATTDTPDSALV